MCLTTLGPGATNATTAVAYAHLAAFPLLCITGQKPILKSKQGAFQIVDVVSMLRPITKFAKQVHFSMLPSYCPAHMHIIYSSAPAIFNAKEVEQTIGCTKMMHWVGSMSIKMGTHWRVKGGSVTACH